MFELLSWLLQCDCRGNDLHKLLDGQLPGLKWLVLVHYMSRGVALRQWSPCSCGVHCRFICRHVSNGMFLLSCWDILGRSSYKLHKLFDRHLPVHDWFEHMYGLSRGVVLCHHRSLGSDRSLYYREILSGVGNSVFKLSRWNI